MATDSDSVIEFNGVEVLEGDFVAANNSALTTLAFDIVKVTGTVLWQNLPVLTNLTLPNWVYTGTMILDTIPQPVVADFTPGAQQINELYIRNTTLAFFVGLTLENAQMDVWEIVGNPYLQNLYFGVGNITRQATSKDNGAGLRVEMPDLTYAYGLEISDASEVDMPKLGCVSTNLHLDGNGFHNVSCADLSFVGGDLSMSDNPTLTQFDLESLVNVQGDLQMINNVQLTRLDGLPALSAVGGDLDVSGPIDRYFYHPAYHYALC